MKNAMTTAVVFNKSCYMSDRFRQRIYLTFDDPQASGDYSCGGLFVCTLQRKGSLAGWLLPAGVGNLSEGCVQSLDSIPVPGLLLWRSYSSHSPWERKAAMEGLAPSGPWTRSNCRRAKCSRP
jgi:hypothetical protein